MTLETRPDGRKEPTTRAPNEAIPLDLKWLQRFSVPEEDVRRKERSLRRRRGPRGEALTEAMMRLLRVIDLTTLSGDDTASRVKALCQRARSPLPQEVRTGLELGRDHARVAAVCTYPVFLDDVLESLQGTEVRAATVAAGFPHGLSPLAQRTAEVARAVEAGAQEVDVVIRREWPLTGKWDLMYQEVKSFREVAGKALLKVILGTGELPTLNQVARAALTAMMAGADFVKTSTGKEKVNATLPAGLAMAVAIRDFHSETGTPVGLKPAGGIRTPAEGVRWQKLAAEELGESWTRPGLFRIGASGLLDTVVTRLGNSLSSG